MDDLQLAVAKLRALSPKLNNAVDQAQRVVSQLERFLADECQVSIVAEVPVVYNDKGVAVTLLRYGRIDGKFRISLTHTDGDARFVSRAWTECDRSEKLASFSLLPKLILAVTKAVEQQIIATTQASKTVSALIVALGADSERSTATKPSAEGHTEMEETRLTIMMQPEEALAAVQVANRPPVRRPAPSKPAIDADPRKSGRKEEAKAS
jgi:hypothetical protein